MTILDRAKAKLGSDYATAKAIGATRGYISKVRLGDRPLSPDAARKIAEVIGEDQIAAAMEALAAQAKTDKDRKAWLRCLQRVSAAAAAVLISVNGVNSTADDLATNQVVGSSNLSGPTM